MEQISTAKCFEGQIRKYQHVSETLGCTMKFHIFLPQKAVEGSPVPVKYFFFFFFFFFSFFLNKRSHLSFSFLVIDLSFRINMY